MLISTQEGASLLHAGQIIAVPTDTVYGIAARVDLFDSVQELFSLKRRTNRKPLVILVASFEHLYSLIENAYLKKVMPWLKIWWPGACTVLLPAKHVSLATQVGSPNNFIGIRIPHHVELLWILEKVGPLAVSSANISGSFPATKPCHIEKDFGPQFPCVYEGEEGQLCGLESTVLRWRHPDDIEILREGWLTIESLRQSWDKTIVSIQSPMNFTTEKHWFLRNSPEGKMDHVSIGFSLKHTFCWGPLNCAEKVAKEFYHVLHLASKVSILKNIYIDPVWPSSNGYWGLMGRRLHDLCNRDSM